MFIMAAVSIYLFSTRNYFYATIALIIAIITGKTGI